MGLGRCWLLPGVLVALCACGEGFEDRQAQAGAGGTGTTGGSTSDGGASTGTGNGEGGAGQGGSGGAPVVHEEIRAIWTDGSVAEAIPVIVSDAAGDVVEELLTDVDGFVQLDLPPGGLVTLLWSDVDGTRMMKTIADLADGEKIQVRLDRRSSPIQNDPMPSVLVETDTAAGATKYYLFASCRYSGYLLSTGPEFSLQGYVGCPGAPTYDLVTAAEDGDGNIMKYGVALDQPFTPSMQASHHVPLTIAPLTATVEVTDVPASAEVSASVAAGRPSPEIWVELPPKSSSLSGPVATFETVVPSGLPNFRRTILIHLDLPFREIGVYSIGLGDPPASTTWSAATAPAAFIDLSLDASDVSRPVLSATLDAKGPTGDTLMFRQSWSSGPAKHWYVLARPAATVSVQLPKLGPAYAGWIPAPADTPATRMGWHMDRRKADAYADVGAPLGPNGDEIAFSSIQF